MLQSECLECRKIYKKVENGKRTVEITHGFCPICLEKIREAKETKRRKRHEDSKK